VFHDFCWKYGTACSTLGQGIKCNRKVSSEYLKEENENYSNFL